MTNTGIEMESNSLVKRLFIDKSRDISQFGVPALIAVAIVLVMVMSFGFYVVFSLRKERLALKKEMEQAKTEGDILTKVLMAIPLSPKKKQP